MTASLSASLRLCPLAMPSPLLAALLLLLGADFTRSVAAVGDDLAVTPVQKVVELLNGMLVKAKNEKHEEAVQWAAYKEFCGNSEASKQESVKAADLQIEGLTASISKHDEEVRRLGQEIDGHEADIVSYKEDLGNATAVRKTEHEDFEKAYQDLDESIYACGKAVAVLQENDKKVPQAQSLLQKLGSMEQMPKAARRVLEAFLSQGVDDEPDLRLVEPPQAHAYETRSGGVIEMIKELQSKFIDQKTQLEKDEMNKRFAYETLLVDYKNNVASAERAIKKKAEAKSEHAQSSAEDKATLTDVRTTREDDMDYLKDLKTTCTQKAADFDSRQKLRTDEIEAIEKAVEIVSGVTETAEKHLPTLLQLSRQKNIALLQYAPVQRNRPSQESAANFLRRQSERIGSHVLSALALHVTSDPFEKVKKLIQDLITKLEQQAKDEATHKAWCDGELADNKVTRDTKTKEVEGLHSKIDGLTANIAKLEKDIATLSVQIAQLTADIALATKLRSEEQGKNEDTIADAVAGQMQIAQAIKVLNDFYAKAADATALMQKKGRQGRKAPPIFEGPYKGSAAGESNSVVAFLEVIQSDFARLEQETTKAESEAKAAHEKFMEDSEKDKTQKQNDVTAAENQKKTDSQDLVTAQNDVELAQTELDSALEYYDKLRPSCLGVVSDTDTTTGHKERIQRREEEIQSLKEALAILDGTEVGDYSDSLHSSVDGGNRGLDVGVTAN